MKRTALILGISSSLLAFGIFTYNHNAQAAASIAASAAESCPCTPDCQPGDPHCTCPANCDK